MQRWRNSEQTIVSKYQNNLLYFATWRKINDNFIRKLTMYNEG